MGEVYLTWADICAAYSGEWVVIVRPPPAERTEVLGGWVVAHSTSENDTELAWQLTLHHQEVALVRADPATAREEEDHVANLDYLMWRPVFVEDELTQEELALAQQLSPPPRRKRWWQFWR